MLRRFSTVVFVGWHYPDPLAIELLHAALKECVAQQIPCAVGLSCHSDETLDQNIVSVAGDLAEIQCVLEKPDVSQRLKIIKQKQPDLARYCWTEETMRLLYDWLETRCVDSLAVRRAITNNQSILERIDIVLQLEEDQVRDNEKAMEYMEQIVAHDSFVAIEAFLAYLKAKAIVCMGVEPAESEQQQLQEQYGDEAATHTHWIRSMGANIQTLLNQLPEGGVVFVISPYALQAKQIAAYLQLQDRPCEIKITEIVSPYCNYHYSSNADSDESCLGHHPTTQTHLDHVTIQCRERQDQDGKPLPQAISAEWDALIQQIVTSYRASKVDADPVTQMAVGGVASAAKAITSVVQAAASHASSVMQAGMWRSTVSAAAAQAHPEGNALDHNAVTLVCEL
jgi:hypothetical protein